MSPFAGGAVSARLMMLVSASRSTGTDDACAACAGITSKNPGLMRYVAGAQAASDDER